MQLKSVIIVVFIALLACLTDCPDGLSAEFSQEVQFGFYADNAIVSSQTMVLDEALNKKIDNIGDSIVKVSDNPNLKYTFRIINDPTINAYSASGGFVYINTGLLDILESQDELAVIMAHEVGHVARKHQLNLVVNSQRIQMAGQVVSGVLGVASAAAGPIVAGAIVPAATSLTTMVLSKTVDKLVQELLPRVGNAVCNEMVLSMVKGYGRENELKADVMAIQYVKKAGYDPKALIRVFKRLSSIRNKLKINDTNYLSNLINAEPGLEARIKEAEKLI